MFKKIAENFAEQWMDEIEVDPKLKNRLEEKLLRPSHTKNPFFNLFNLNIMKRYSFPVLATLTVLVFVITSVIKTPLEPQEVLAKALEQYKGDGIYHEKILTEASWDDPLIAGYQPIKKEEIVWERYTDEWGNSLSVIKNLLTNEFSVYLSRVNEFGDMAIYSYSSPIISNELNLERIELPLTSEEERWFEVFQGEKFYCYEKVEGKNRAGQGEIFLIMAAEDPSVYVLQDFIAKKEDSYYYNKLQNLWERPSSEEKSNSTKVFLETLMKNPDLEYKGLSKKNGRKYHVFEDEFNIKGSISESQYYIDAETYQLSYQKTEHSFFESEKEKEGEEERTVLLSEYLNDSEGDSIFDPARFGGMLKKEERPHYSFPPFLKESGCFDTQGKKMGDDFFQQLPSTLKEEWHKKIEEVEGGIDNVQDNQK